MRTHVTIADTKYHKGQIQKIKPVDGDGVRPWGFAAEMWPVVHKNCLSCHGDEKTAPLRAPDQGGAEGKGLRLVMKSAEDAYRMLHPYVRRPGPESEIPVLTPLDYHVSTSPLVQILRAGHKGVELTDEEWRQVEHMSRMIVRKILRMPMMKLNSAAGTENEEFYIDAMRALFKLDTIGETATSEERHNRYRYAQQ